MRTMENTVAQIIPSIITWKKMFRLFQIAQQPVALSTIRSNEHLDKSTAYIHIVYM